MENTQAIEKLGEVETFLGLPKTPWESIKACFNQHNAAMARLGITDHTVIKDHETTRPWLTATVAKCYDLRPALKQVPKEELERHLLAGLRLRKKTARRNKGGKGVAAVKSSGSGKRSHGESDATDSEEGPTSPKKKIKSNVELDDVTILLRNDITRLRKMVCLLEFVAGDADQESSKEGDLLKRLTFSKLQQHMPSGTLNLASQSQIFGLDSEAERTEISDDVSFTGYIRYMRKSNPYTSQFTIVLHNPATSNEGQLNAILQQPSPVHDLAGQVENICIRVFDSKMSEVLSAVQTAADRMTGMLDKIKSKETQGQKVIAADPHQEDEALQRQAEADARAAEEEKRLDSEVAQRQEAEATKPDAPSNPNDLDHDLGNDNIEEDEDAAEERARERAAWLTVDMNPGLRNRLIELMIPFPDLEVDELTEQYDFAEDALPLHFFWEKMDKDEKRQMHRNRLYAAVRHDDRVLRRARDFDGTHNLGIGVLHATTRPTSQDQPQRSFVDLTVDDEDEPEEIQAQQIAEELQSHTLQATLDQRLGYVFYLLAASLFMFDPESSQRDDFELSFGGFLVNLRLHQLEDIVYALVRMNSTANGCFLGHIMGFGKTLMQLAIAQVLDWGAQALDHIDAYPDDHLESTNDGKSQCPSQRLWPIACPCRRSSASFWLRNLFDRRGMVMMIQPLTLIPNLKNEWEKFIDPKASQLKMWIHHHDDKVTGDFPPATKQDFLKWEKHDHTTPTRSELTRNILVTTKGSFKGQIRDVAKTSWWENMPQYTQKKELHKTVPYKDVYRTRELDIHIKAAFQDECHLVRGYDMDPQKFMRALQCQDSLKKTHHAALVFASGTPTVNSPTDMNELVRAMEGVVDGGGGYWAKVKHLDHCSWDVVAKLTADINKTMASVKTSIATVKAAVSNKDSAFYGNIQKQRRIMQTLMVRRQEDSRGWHGEPLRDIGISNVYHVEVGGEWDPKIHDAVMQVLEEARRANTKNSKSGQVSKTDILNTGRQARIIAGIPWLAQYIVENPGFTGTQEQMTEAGWLEEPKKSPFYKHSRAILKSSPKLQQLVAIRKGQTVDINGRPEKLVVFSEFPISVFIAKIVSTPASLGRSSTDNIIDYGKGVS